MNHTCFKDPKKIIGLMTFVQVMREINQLLDDLDVKLNIRVDLDYGGRDHLGISPRSLKR